MISPQEFDRLRRNYEEAKSEKDRIAGAVAEFKKKLKEDFGTAERNKLKEMLRKEMAKRERMEEEFIPLKEKFDEALQRKLEDD
jgi:hypothetical protein